jgi:hypothetical protein
MIRHITVVPRISPKGSVDMNGSPPPFSPDAIFAAGHATLPAVLAAPARYIQGNGVLGQLGQYLSLVPSRRPVILISAGGQRRDG